MPGWSSSRDTSTLSTHTGPAAVNSRQDPLRSAWLAAHQFAPSRSWSHVTAAAFSISSPACVCVWRPWARPRRWRVSGLCVLLGASAAASGPLSGSRWLQDAALLLWLISITSVSASGSWWTRWRSSGRCLCPSGGKMVDRLANSEANSKRIAFVESCFGAAGQPLAIPGRVLIGEGILTKLCRKKPKTRQFFLFNDILVYGNILIQKKKYNKQHIIPLEGVTIDTVPDEGELRNGWLIKTPTKSFAVYAATATEKSEWMNHIGKCVNDLLQKSGKAPTGEHAAVWVPDSEATVCMRCQKVKFTPVSRRHHCRKCGLVVCGPCSEKKFLLPSQSSKPVRVCEFCYVQLMAGGVAPRSDSMSRPAATFSSSNLSDDDDDDDSSD